MEILELDLSWTWPRQIREIVESVANEHPEYITLDTDKSDSIPDDVRWEITDVMTSIPIVVYHATKLLKHEIESVKSSGLQPLGKEMLIHRIEQALSHGCIADDFAKLLLDSGLKSASAPNREGKVSVFTSRLALRREYGFQELFSWWGGEALRDKFVKGDPVFKTLELIGEPTIIRGYVDLESQIDLFQGYFDLTFNLFKVWGERPEQEQKGGIFSVPSLSPDSILEVITERLNPKEWADIAPMSGSSER